LVLFLFLQFGTAKVFDWFIKSPEILQGSLDYIKMRSFGVFFSFSGVAIIAFLTGVARTRFIIYDTIVLLVVNVVLNYVLIFGKWGAPEMGIEGAALASALAEVVAFVVFIFYFIFSKVPREIGMLSLPGIHFGQMKQILNLSIPIVSQSVVSLGGWFLFFSFIEKFLGADDLAISNLVRNVYLILIIPSWGYSSGINTLVSHFIGNRKRMAVEPMIYRTAKTNLISTLIIAVPVILFPSFFLYPLFGGEDMSLLYDAQGSLYVLLAILVLYSLSIIYFNGMVGTGATIFGLKVQFIGSASYLVVVYILLSQGIGSLEMAWGSEMIYWGIMQFMCWKYLRTRKWYKLKV
jgi:Na+-driven multidrug efflux pump